MTPAAVHQLYLIAAAFGLGYGGVLPSYPIIIRDYLGGAGAGARTGMVVFFGTIGGATGPILAGGIYDLTDSYAWAFATLATLATLGLALVLKLPASGARA